MKVVELPVYNLKDVPASLRRLADSIEAGEVPNCQHALVVSESTDGEITVYGYGAVESRAYGIGVLHLAIARLTGQ